MKYWVTILFFGLLNLGYSQYFNNRYDFSLQLDNGTTILETFDGYIVAGTAEDSLGDNAIGIIKLDYFGNEIWKKIHPPPVNHGFYTGYQGSFSVVDGGGFIMTGGIVDTMGNYNVYLYRFDDHGDSLWFKQHDLNGRDLGIQCIQDGPSFVVVGSRSTSNYNLLILKTDTLGNYIWHNTFGGAITEIGYSVISSFDGGYMLGGYSNSWTNDIEDYNTYVVKVDSLGSFEWEKNYGDSVSDCPAFIKSTTDGNYVIATCIGTQVLAGEVQTKSRVIKIDPIGDIIWDSQLGDPRSVSELYNIHELPDGSFITGGTRADTLGSPAPYNGWPNGLVIKLDSEGNEIWTREHEYFTSSNSHNYLRDISPTSDGGYIACGFIFLGTGDTGTQDMWVIKMDAEGYDTGLDLVSSENGSMSIYPNPTTSTITLNNLQLGDEVSVYNTLGQRVYSSKVSAVTLSINLSELGNNGIYFVRVNDISESVLLVE
jgi:hypothetical protein